MPVEKSQKLTLVDYPEKGVNTNLDADVNIQGETTLTIQCESPTCTKSISWIVEKAGEDINSVPDDAFRILIIEEFGGKKGVFCSWDCLRRAMKNYVPQLSPREKAQIEQINKSVDEARTVATINEVAAAMQNPVAVSQPDGFAEGTTVNE